MNPVTGVNLSARGDGDVGGGGEIGGFDSALRFKMSAIKAIMEKKNAIGLMERDKMLASIMKKQRDGEAVRCWTREVKRLEEKMREAASEIEVMAREALEVENTPPDINIKIHVSVTDMTPGGGRGRSRHKTVLPPDQLNQGQVDKHCIPTEIAEMVLETQIKLLHLQQDQQNMVDEADLILESINQ